MLQGRDRQMTLDPGLPGSPTPVGSLFVARATATSNLEITQVIARLTGIEWWIYYLAFL